MKHEAFSKNLQSRGHNIRLNECGNRQKDSGFRALLAVSQTIFKNARLFLRNLNEVNCYCFRLYKESCELVFSALVLKEGSVVLRCV